jgi:hypothetical protein
VPEGGVIVTPAYELDVGIPTRGSGTLIAGAGCARLSVQLRQIINAVIRSVRGI